MGLVSGSAKRKQRGFETRLETDFAPYDHILFFMASYLQVLCASEPRVHMS